ncbi:MAG: HD domain-containing protein [Tissierellia bacterium]|nr:HD domain-containing protein [Tissierellia bacterium]
MDSKILENLRKDLGEDRLKHVLRVVDVARELARVHGVDIKKAETAALFHDCAKFQNKNNLLKSANDFDIILDDIMMRNTELIHGPLGAKIAETKYKIKDEDILKAIAYHTTGRKNMSKLEKLIYIADYIEPGRKFEGIERVRKLAFEDLDKSILLAMDQTIIFLIKNDKLISIDTLDARNHLLMELN